MSSSLRKAAAANPLLKRIKQELVFLREKRTKEHVRTSDYDIGNGNRLYYWRLPGKTENLGDFLSTVVVEHFVPQKDTWAPRHGKTLYAIGSILGFRCQEAVVWGSGLIFPQSIKRRRIQASELDIRAVRGPKTRQQLLDWGKECPEVYGDPAILMPQIYMPRDVEKIYDVSLVLHYDHADKTVLSDCHVIDIQTSDYKAFIDQICASSLVISSSLHGVILAETYGVPAVLMQPKGVPFKYEDWYLSTGRENIVIADSIEEARALTPMPLPDLTAMQEQLRQAFPTDLWTD